VLTAPLAVANTGKGAGRGGCIKAINVTGMADLSKDDSEGIQKRARELGGKGVVEIRCGSEGKWRSPVEKHLTADEKQRLTDALGARDGDLLLLCAGPERDDVSLILGGIRSHCAKLMMRRGKLSIPSDQYNFLWVEEFPLFSFESANAGEDKRIVTTHHPFTAPHPDDIDLLMSSNADHDLLRVRYSVLHRWRCHVMRVRVRVLLARLTRQRYGARAGVCTMIAWSMASSWAVDRFVCTTKPCNGNITVSRPHVDVCAARRVCRVCRLAHDAFVCLRHIFRVLGMSDNVMTRFQHLLDALGMGCPPHGGLAIGFDRCVPPPRSSHSLFPPIYVHSQRCVCV
jgi:hypothetical protein